MKSVAIIIVNWNGKVDTLECLASLRTDCYNHKFIIVVDNGSRDDSVIALRASHPEVEVLPTGQNLGFTGGNNIGIGRAIERNADYIFLLNNDTTLQPNAVIELMKAAEQYPQAGLYTPLIHYFDRPNEIWFSGSKMDLAVGQAVHDNSLPPTRKAEAYNIPWASGCAMLIPAGLMKQLSGFDDRFFLNWEDVDLSLRIRNAGYEIMLVPSALIYHKVGRTLAAAGNTGLYYHVRNRLLLLRIHVEHQYLCAYMRVLIEILRVALRALFHQENNGWKGFCLVLRAICDDLSGRFGRAADL